MKINNLTKEEVIKSLVTSENGLTEEEAGKRLIEFGHNEISEIKKKSLILKFFSQFTHFLALLLWFAALLSFLSGYIHPGEGMFALGLAIVSVIIINAIFAFIQEYRAEKALEAMKKLLPFYVKVIRDQKEKEIYARDVVPGDIVLLSEGDKVPADIRLLSANEIKVNNAPLTGEAEPVARDAEPCSCDIINSPNIAFAGTTTVSGSGKGVVFATGMRTEFGMIAQLTETVTSGPSPLQKEITKITRVVTAIAATMGVIFFVIGYLIGRTFWENFLFTIGIILANVPEGLLPTVTLSLAMGSQRMVKRNALIKSLTSVETLGSVSVICTDKTGTLTQNNMAVTTLWQNNRITDIRDFKTEADNLLMKTAYLCNNVRYIDNQYKGDPTEVALLSLVRDKLGDFKAERLQEIPFDSDRKRMTTLNIINGKTFAFTKGAMETIIPLCTHLLAGDKKIPLTEDSEKQLITDYHSLMDKGLRVLGFAYKDMGERAEYAVQDAKSEYTALQVEKDMTFIGLIGLEDPPRPEVPEALKKCHEAGITVIMITGDGSRTAVAIAREIGLVKGTPVVIEGSEFMNMSDKELREKLAEKEIIFARMTPKHKLRVVTILKEAGERVAVTGDGVNDAPALKKADIGIAMGITGTDVAKEAADMVLLDDNFATIVNAIEEGRTIFENIKKFIIYILAHLTPEAVPYILFVLLKIPLPLSVMQILAIDLGTETLPALGLGIEQPEVSIMKQPPRPLNKGLIDRSVLLKGYVFLGLTSTMGVLFVYFLTLYKGGWQWGTALEINNSLVLQASTATFLGIVIMQIGNVFACRTQTESVFSVGIFNNKLVLWGILAEIILSAFIIYHPWGNRIFSTAPIALNTWLILLPFAALLIFSEEARKAVQRKFSKRLLPK